MASADKLRGFVGQALAAKKPHSESFIRVIDTITGSGSFTATVSCTVFLWAWGAGGSAAINAALTASGGGGGGAGFKAIKLAAGQTISWTIGAGGVAQTVDSNNGFDGGDTSVTLPGGAVLIAGGGKKGIQGAPTQTGGLGGACVGPWDVARGGGNGGNGVSPNGTAGGSPSGGGTGGAASGTWGGGGGAAGFSDKVPGLVVGGNGCVANAGSNTSTAPGAGIGGTGSTTTFPGRDGRLIAYAVQVKV